ncbi:hypothetical protein [Salinispora tropica]|uniref:hypothetical protein n=1 Tax=Salinispora tropica TaxID=168695 RepID=UPI0002EEA3A4|nr:hypothetical protein [Salinispora tropica]
MIFVVSGSGYRCSVPEDERQHGIAVGVGRAKAMKGRVVSQHRDVVLGMGDIDGVEV